MISPVRCVHSDRRMRPQRPQPSDVEVTRDHTASGRLGRPVLSTTEALAESLAIGPIVSVGLVAFLIAGAAGANAPLVVVIVTVGSLALGWTVSLYARRFASAGGVYQYLAAHGPHIGVLGAGLYFLPALVTFLVPLASSLRFQEFATQHLGFDPGWWTGALASTAIVFALAYLGVRISVRVLLGLTVLAAVPMLVLAFAVIAQDGATGNTLSVFDPGAAGGGDIFRGLLFGALIFAGLEAAACVGEEARLPHRSIPRAILLSVAIAGGFYLLMVYAATIGFGPTEAATAWGQDPVAFAGLGDRYVGSPLSALISLAILLDNLAVQLAVVNNFSRGYFALAREGLLPRALAGVSRHGTPVAGLAMVSAGGLAVAFGAAFFDDHFEMFELAAIAFTLTLMPVYLALALGAVRFLHGRRHVALGLLAVLAAAAVPALAVYGTFDPFPTGTRRAGIGLAVAVLAGILVWYAYLRAKRPSELAAAGARFVMTAGARPGEALTPRRGARPPQA